MHRLRSKWQPRPTISTDAGNDVRTNRAHSVPSLERVVPVARPVFRPCVAIPPARIPVADRRATFLRFLPLDFLRPRLSLAPIQPPKLYLRFSPRDKRRRPSTTTTQSSRRDRR